MKVRDFLLESKVPFKLKFPEFEDLDMNFLYLGWHNAVTNLFNKMADERGMAAPITVQVMEDMQECDADLKKIMGKDLKGADAVEAWYNVLKKYYTRDFSFIRTLSKKYKQVRF